MSLSIAQINASNYSDATKAALIERRKRYAKEAYKKRLEKIGALRKYILSKLTNYCVLCGSIDDLQLDHPKGRNWSPNKFSAEKRLKKYLEDQSNDNLRVLCALCNRRDGGKRLWEKKLTSRPKQ
jgi:hypothetical protein